ncbi:hypothetical protein [Candidatus Thioglobus sp.]|uniref:hypothetical protein n=1 Tax=Candidatus Thioglobus sp. TaxID=2026721 RepID=UPI0026301FED|nr:hypothetical protein [Candidatus Thioglobus sp.]MDG2394729.1 hypothetical protein [Candidatus Thioglobus sp.]
MVSRRKESLGGKRYNPLDVGYKMVISSLDALKKNGYIIQIIDNHNKGAITTIESTDKLVQWFKDTEWSDDRIDKKVGTYVTLRESRKQNNNAVYIDFEDTKYSKWLGERIRQYDQLLSNFKIALLNDDGVEDKEFKKFTIQRRFINHQATSHNMGFVFGGRISGPWVNLSSDLRKNITINGDTTVELDRSASNLNAMYQVITGAPYPRTDNPYQVEVDGVAVPKHITKNFSSFMQGSKSPKSAAHSVLNHYKRKALEVKNPKDKDIEKYTEYVEFKKSIKPTDIAQAFLDKHPKIANYFNKGKAYGDLISCWESDIVFEVVMELTKRGIPCLTVNNSFIVPLQYKDLVESMKDITSYVDRREKLKEMLT